MKMNSLMKNQIYTLNSFYRPFFIRYTNLIAKNKLTSTMQPDYITDKPTLGVVIINKEKWILFSRKKF